jgi:hypothetical protein
MNNSDFYEHFKQALRHDGMSVEAASFSTESDCDLALRSPWYFLCFIPVPDQLEMEVEEFKLEFTRQADEYHLLSPSECVKACRSLLASMDSLKKKGYVALYAVYISDDDYRVAAILFGPIADEQFRNLAYLNVPRHFEEFARAA